MLRTAFRNIPAQALSWLAQLPLVSPVLSSAVTHGPGWVREPLGRLKRKHRRLAYVMVPEKALRTVLRRGLNRLVEMVGAAGVGDYLEFGVHSCSSLLCMYRELEALSLKHVRLFGFDSFEGLPQNAEYDDGGHWSPGQFRCDYDFARQILADEGVDRNRVVLTPGWFSDTLTPQLIERVGLTKASVIMVDCDTYLSAKEALTFSAPFIRDHALVLFDDWHAGNLAARNLGEQRAFDEFLNDGCFTVEPFDSYTSNAEVFLISRRAAPHTGVRREGT